jgi:hypothetical protein
MIPGELPAAGETRHFLVWWVLAILCRSQHMCLFSESRKVLGVTVVNIGAVFQDIWLISCGEFINFMLEAIYSVHEMVFIQSKCLCNHDSLEVSGVVDLAFTSCSRHVLHFVRQVRGGGGIAASLLADWERRRKKLRERCRT